MHWLMTGGNHGTFYTCGENTSLHCDESYYFDSLPKGSKGQLMDAKSIHTPTKLAKLELGCQIPVKSLCKIRCDVVKASVRNLVSSDVNAHKKLNESGYWSVNKHKTTNREFQCSGPKEYALPNSKTGFFYECVTQKFYECNLDKNLFVEDDDVEEDEMLEPFDVSGSYMGRMMELSSELTSFLIGGPRLFENNAIVETFKNGHKAIMHRIILLKYIKIVIKFMGCHCFTVNMKALPTHIFLTGNRTTNWKKCFKMQISMVM